MSKLEVNTLAPQTGTTITIGESGDTVALGSGATQSGFGGTNTPAFWSYQHPSGTSIPNATATKITNLTDYIDTDSAFASSRFTVPSGKDGKYIFFGTLVVASATSLLVGFGLNGTFNPSFLGGYNTLHEHASERGVHNSIMFDLVAGDYVELYAYTVGGSTLTSLTGGTRFYGYKIIE